MFHSQRYYPRKFSIKLRIWMSLKIVHRSQIKAYKGDDDDEARRDAPPSSDRTARCRRHRWGKGSLPSEGEGGGWCVCVCVCKAVGVWASGVKGRGRQWTPLSDGQCTVRGSRQSGGCRRAATAAAALRRRPLPLLFVSGHPTFAHAALPPVRSPPSRRFVARCSMQLSLALFLSGAPPHHLAPLCRSFSPLSLLRRPLFRRLGSSEDAASLHHSGSWPIFAREGRDSRGERVENPPVSSRHRDLKLKVRREKKRRRRR